MTDRTPPPPYRGHWQRPAHSGGGKPRFASADNASDGGKRLLNGALVEVAASFGLPVSPNPHGPETSFAKAYREAAYRAEKRRQAKLRPVRLPGGRQ